MTEESNNTAESLAGQTQTQHGSIITIQTSLGDEGNGNYVDSDDWNLFIRFFTLYVVPSLAVSKLATDLESCNTFLANMLKLANRLATL